MAVPSVPVQRVVDLRQQGADNNRIIEVLRSENYSFQQIRDAIQQADIKKNVASPGTPVQQQMPSPPMGSPPPSQPSMGAAPQPVQQAMPAPTPMPNKPMVDLDEIQRVLEEIIAEKWKDSEKTINQILEWRAMVNTKIKEFDARINEFSNRIDALNTVLGQKAEAFNETMQNVDTEIRALEKALNKLVPTLSDNISELKGLVTNINKKD
ncbi:MAG: hypothetical protein JW791_00895 [Nanoarchaeota archaeon]|nr:hypothetical protein [Nanoarchaeota archaeon]